MQNRAKHGGLGGAAMLWHAISAPQVTGSCKLSARLPLGSPRGAVSFPVSLPVPAREPHSGIQQQQLLPPSQHNAHWSRLGPMEKEGRQWGEINRISNGNNKGPLAARMSAHKGATKMGSIRSWAVQHFGEWLNATHWHEVS